VHIVRQRKNVGFQGQLSEERSGVVSTKLPSKGVAALYGIALILSVPITIDSLPYGFLWFGLVWLVLGYVLWTQRAASVERPRRVR
jgi:hypothetical protein